MDIGKIALVGAMNSGKTEIIQRLSELGYNTVNEAATEMLLILQQELGSEKKQKEWLEKDIFTPGIESTFFARDVKSQLEKESHLLGGKLYFLDRGIWDYQAFCILRERIIPEGMETIFLSHLRYDKVFISDCLPVFDERKGSGRVTDQDAARRMTEICRKTYQESGHEVIDIPIFENDGTTVLSVSDRTNFILDSL